MSTTTLPCPPGWGTLRAIATAQGERASAAEEQALDEHHAWAAEEARGIATKLNPPPDIADAVVLATSKHDRGKHRGPWQLAIGNGQYPDKVLAKSGIAASTTAAAAAIATNWARCGI